MVLNWGTEENGDMRKTQPRFSSREGDVLPSRSGWGTPTLTNHAVDCAEENRALRRCGRLAQVLHDQRPVAEDIDELSQVGQPHLLQVLALLIGRGRTEIQSTLLYPCWGDTKAFPVPTSLLLRAGHAPPSFPA